MIISRSSAKVAKVEEANGSDNNLSSIKRLLASLGINHSKPMCFYCDNLIAFHIVDNLVFHELANHKVQWILWSS